MPPTLAQLRVLFARRLRVRPRAWPSSTTAPQRRPQPWLLLQQQHRQCTRELHLARCAGSSQQQQSCSLRATGAELRRRWFMAASTDSDSSASIFQRMLDHDDEHDDGDNDDHGHADGSRRFNEFGKGGGRSDIGDDRNASSGAAALSGTAPFTAAREGDAFAVDTLPALKVLSETFGLIKQSPAFQNWNSTDWLMGLTVLAQHNTIQRKKKRVLSVLSDEANKKTMENQELMEHLLKYVRVCDAVYASTLRGFCEEARVARESVVKHHSGGVFSPKFVLLLDHASREIVLVVRGSASLMDFCTDLCLVNEPFQHGQGHRGMVHAATWLARAVESDLRELAAAHPDYRVVATGHSLGASVAALATMLLRPAVPAIHCFAFATPASVTRELASECYEYVTTVVNGDDCVPRLHQHSIHKLQGEVSAFDWRSTLKRLVTDEVEEQRSAVARHKDEKIEQVYRAIRKFEELSLKQQHDAIEKIDHVKRLATENITELTNEIDRRVTASIDSTLSPFRADKISSSHVQFIQKLLRTDDKQKLPFLWEKLDASVLALERLSAAVNKPEELERLIRESKELLKHTAAAPTDAAAGANAPPPPLAMFRDRINSVINDATESLKSTVKGKMTQVTATVTTNMTDVVETVKVEAEAISSRIQSELDAAQRELADSAETLLPRAVSLPAVDSIDSMFQDLKAEVIDLAQLFSSSNRSGSGSHEGDGFDSETEDESELEASEVDAFEALAALEDASQAADAPPRASASPRDELMHEPLFPPGRILYLNRVLPAESQADEASALGEEVELVEVGNDEFSRVVLSNNMILDHLCTTYERMLQSTKILPPGATDAAAASDASTGRSSSSSVGGEH